MDRNNEIVAFQEKIKRHLSDEYLFVVEKKDDLENQLLHLQAEKEKKNKTLFPGFDQKDIRKYFSPLNLKEPEYEDIDEKDKQISLDIERVENDIRKINYKLSEIKEIIRDIDDISKLFIVSQKLDLSNYEDSDEDEYIADDYKDENYQEVNYQVDKYQDEDYRDEDYRDEDYRDEDYQDEDYQDGDYQDNDYKDDDYQEKEFQEEENKGDNSEEKVDQKECSNFDDVIGKVYPQMLRNLYEFSDSLKERYKELEVLIEFSDNNIETPVEINRSIIKQINYNIEETIKDFEISTIFIQGEITAKRIYLSINYVCDNEDIDAMNVIYEYTNV